MIAIRLQISGIVSRWDDAGVGEDVTIQPVVISATTPAALKAQALAVLDQLAATAWPAVGDKGGTDGG